ncbi:ABC1 kinase family protein [Campylobacter corcagiensis]|uniref:AarF/ABC1/UbiB kinase family protein n=1 Tax=Campylobacter corcagiensis TaxID=1448857 RepID=A0A7M1LFI7_9BACT|nr:AarF/UbiB family protein [Campylobacter corcagiensis]QKF64664.1 putative ubiquinone biosynthesis protein kinase [Campylobacter corcagiensis]QOQ87170.1 AarF/ABC1/UbiB kinase family protein [Campylobacter corcagiensis]
MLKTPRFWLIFRLLLTFYLLIKRREKLIFLRPLKPSEISEAINTLGASFIKLAQVLASRSDFFPPEYTDELKKVHDKLPAMKNSDVLKVADTSKFAKFDMTPIASASIGQVHVAYLDDGTKLAVKLRRYGIKQRVKKDIAILRRYNALFRPLFSHYTKHSIEAVLSEFSDMILKEISFDRELANLQRFSKVYANSGVKFPRPYPELSNDSMLVMSFEDGFRFDDKENILKFGIDIRKVIKTLVLFYVDQMLVNGYFHADPHPGNLLITKDAKLVLLDFGMVKSVDNETRLAIIALLKAANEENYEKYILACKKLGISAYETPTALLAEFTEEFFAIFSNDNLDKTTMQDLAFSLMESSRKFPFKLPSEAIYILRASAIIEGLGTNYIENFNGVKDILPILVENIPRAVGVKETFVENIFDATDELLELIVAMKDGIYKISSGELETQISKLQLSYFKKAADEAISSFMISFTLIMSSFFLLLLDKGFEILASVLFLIGILRLLFKR